MVVQIFENIELTHNEANPGAWTSTGEDPGFIIGFGAVRRPFLTIFLSARTDCLEPKLYINKGRGYHEEDAVTFKSTKNVAIIIELGTFGFNRRIRLDPATQPCDFSLSVTESNSRVEAEDRALNWCKRVDGDFWDVGIIPRFRLSFPGFRRSPTSEIRNYLDSIYKLAQTEPEPPLCGETTLSVVVPVFNAPKRHLSHLVESFLSQATYGVELVLSDDGSTFNETLDFYRNLRDEHKIRLVLNGKNRGISNATNAGILRSCGKWVTFLDHDDLIAPHAFKMILLSLSKNPDLEFLYTDEVVVSENLDPISVMMKPAYDPVLLSGLNYINHFSIYRRDKLLELGLLNPVFDGSQDYEILLKYLDTVSAERVYHLPFPAYWWRRTKGSYSQRFIEKATFAARSALKESFGRKGVTIEVKPAITPSLHRVDLAYSCSDDWPKVSIIIPTRDSYDLIECVLRGIFERTNYPDFEVIVVDNGTTDERVLDLYGNYKKYGDRFRTLIKYEPFNFSRSINYGFEEAKGQSILLLNNDVEICEPDWLREMVSCLRYEGIGIVGAKLLYPNQTIQHAGVIAGLGGLAGHWFSGKPENFGGPMNRLHVRNSVVCVTGAVMLISRSCLELVGKFDDGNFAIAYNDVDFCLRAHRAGIRAVWTPFASLYHHESLSRGADTSGVNKRRFESEQANLQRLHSTGSFEDPTIHPGYSKKHSVPSLSVPLEIFNARTNRGR